MEVDLVYLWVNGNDPKWQAKRNAVIGNVETKSAVNCKGRYADNDELKYSLRSVELYAPWIRNIYIVTDDQVPEWLDTSHPKIHIVDHKDIMPPQSLPCFNSSLLEHFLHRIPGLAEHFIYSNDDMYINKPVTPLSFFASDGLPLVRFSRRPFRKLGLWFRKHIQRKPLSNYNIIIQNAARLVEKKYGVYYGGKAHHNMDAYRKSDCRHVDEIFSNELNAMLENHVRSNNDVQRSIYSYTALAEKRAHLVYVTQKTSFRVHIHNKDHYAKLEKYNPMLFCMNDSQFAQDADRQRSKQYLEKRFPVKSKFEK